MLIVLGIVSCSFAILFFIMIKTNKKMYLDLVRYCDMYYAENRKFSIVSFASSKTCSGIKKFFEDNEYTKIAVYGVGVLYNLFQEELKAVKHIQIMCFIDKYDTRKSVNGTELLKMEQIGVTSLDVDLILVTVVYGYEEIKKELEKRTNNKIKIVNIEEIVYWY